MTDSLDEIPDSAFCKVMPFGKYKDEKISDIEDTDYLKWILKEYKDISNDLWEAINEEIESRL